MYILCPKCKGAGKLKLSKSEATALEQRGWNWDANIDPKYFPCSRCKRSGEIRVLSPTEEIAVEHTVET